MLKNKKDAILEIAKRLFAEKGYDATGMDEIASMTEIPKSLIYYHFKNKKDLLNTIILNLLREYEQILKDETQRGIDKIECYIQFAKKNKYCIKILLMESLKQTDNNTIIFKTVETLKKSDPEFGNHLHLIAEFFTSILPSLLFVCYEENWCKYFSVMPEIMENDFHMAYRLTHGAYHKFIDKESL